MQGHDSSEGAKETKVVSIFGNRKDKSSEPPTRESQGKEEDEEFTKEFTDVIKQNQKNKERMERERASANKSVLRSYRIKH